MKFKIERDWLCLGYDMFEMDEIEFGAGLTVLVGCNGYGKTTMLHQISDQLDRYGLNNVVRFNNMTDGGVVARQGAHDAGDMMFTLTSSVSSEGENIIINLNKCAKQIGRAVRLAKDGDEKSVFVLFDGIDSGLSIDNMADVKKYLVDVAIQDCVGSGVYIYFIVSANTYEFAKREHCVDVRTGNDVRFTEYEEYRNFVMESRKIKDKREEKITKTRKGNRRHE